MAGRVGALLAACAAVVLTAGSVEGAPSFITRSGAKLEQDGKQFRFGGSNMYWLGLDENVPPHTTAYPTPFRVQDAVNTTSQYMGMRGSVVRCHTCGISVGNPLSVWPRLGETNPKALQVIDYAVQQAAEAGLRLVIPLVDNWHYYHGGKHTFTDWRNVTEAEFYTDPQVNADFKAYVTVIVNHTSVYGRRFAEEPAIMAWETGNELNTAPAAWTLEIAAHLKSLAPQQLVSDGNVRTPHPEVLASPDVDMFSIHQYPPDALAVLARGKTVTGANKVFFVGEYGWDKSPDLAQYVGALEASGMVSGDLFWSLFPHNDDFGFVQHGDHYTLHFPGDSPALAADVETLRRHAFTMAGAAVPSLQPPATAPKITQAAAGVIAWRGAAGAGNYTVRRQCGDDSRVVCAGCVSDNQTPWTDSSRPPTSTPCSYSVCGHLMSTAVMGPCSPYASDA